MGAGEVLAVLAVLAALAVSVSLPVLVAAGAVTSLVGAGLLLAAVEGEDEGEEGEGLRNLSDLYAHEAPFSHPHRLPDLSGTRLAGISLHVGASAQGTVVPPAAGLLVVAGAVVVVVVVAGDADGDGDGDASVAVVALFSLLPPAFVASGAGLVPVAAVVAAGLELIELSFAPLLAPLFAPLFAPALVASGEGLGEGDCSSLRCAARFTAG